MCDVNSVTITGYIKNYKTAVNGGTMVLVEQCVADKKELLTKFTLFIPEKVCTDFKKSKLKIGDRILISNAVIYTLKGILKLKINSLDQIIVISKKINLGEEEASEKFNKEGNK